MMAGWGGQGASAFSNLMLAWQEKQETILKALDQLSRAIESCRRANKGEIGQLRLGYSGRASHLLLPRLRVRGRPELQPQQHAAKIGRAHV